MLKKTIIVLSLILIITSASILSIALADTYSDYGDQVTWTANTMNLGLKKQKATITIKNRGNSSMRIKITNMSDCTVKLDKPLEDKIADTLTFIGTSDKSGKLSYYLGPYEEIKMQVSTSSAKNGVFSFSIKGTTLSGGSTPQPFTVEFDIDDEVRTMVADAISDERRSELGFNSQTSDDDNQNKSGNASKNAANKTDQKTNVSTDNGAQGWIGGAYEPGTYLGQMYIANCTSAPVWLDSNLSDQIGNLSAGKLVYAFYETPTEFYCYSDDVDSWCYIETRYLEMAVPYDPTGLGSVERSFHKTAFDDTYATFWQRYPDYEAFDKIYTNTTKIAGWSMGNYLFTAGSYYYYCRNDSSGTVPMRKEADVSSGVIMSIPCDEIVLVNGEWNGWMLCMYNDRYGWIESRFLVSQDDAEEVAEEVPEEAIEEVAEEVAEEAAEEVVVEPEPFEYDEPIYSSDDIYDLSNYGYRTVTTQGRGALVFQSEPYGSFMKEYKYGDGDQLLVNLYWEEGDYTIAYDNGTYGYVDTSFIDWDDSAYPDEPDIYSDEYREGVYEESGDPGYYLGEMYVVNCDSWISLRESPDTGSSRLAKIPLGAAVEVYAYDQAWGFCTYGNQVGYVLMEYLSYDAPGSFKYDENDDYEQGYESSKASDEFDLSNYDYRAVQTNGRGALVFQSAPRGSFMSNYKFNDGDWVYVNVNWRSQGYAIAYENGTYGYVDASYIDW